MRRCIWPFVDQQIAYPPLRACLRRFHKLHESCNPNFAGGSRRWHSPSLGSERKLSTQWTSIKENINTDDTIYALSTAPGRAAIAVLRVSGPACLDIYRRLCPNRAIPQPRVATLRKLYHPEIEETKNSNVLDNAALILYFPNPDTVTGEDVLELHVHGGPAIVKSILQAIPRSFSSKSQSWHEIHRIRHAEPGEFTKRAFYNGRLDLTQAEALGETLAAETEQQRRLAVAGAESGLSERYEEWRTMLLYARGELEALIDFSEDQHFDESPVELMGSVAAQVEILKTRIELHIKNASKGELLRNGISISLLGAPNAGKSSLLNLVVGREAAIVSAEEGTTRDVIDVNVDIAGWLCRLGDMAGIRSDNFSGTARFVPSIVGSVEREGIRRARERALQSDVVILLLSVETTPNGDVALPINPEVLDAVQDCQDAGREILVAINKADLAGPFKQNHTLRSDLTGLISQVLPDIPRERVFIISCKEAEISLATQKDPGGIQAFLNGLINIFGEMTNASVGSNTESISTTEAQSYWTASLSVTHRQSEYLQQCLLYLQDFLANARPPEIAQSLHSEEAISSHKAMINKPAQTTLIADDSGDVVTAAEHLRFAAECLAKITGRGESGDIEDVLGVVFEK